MFQLPPSLSGLLSAEIVSQYPRRVPNQSLHPTLRSLTAASLFPVQVRSVAHAQCVLSGLWLIHGFLDQAHEICQAIPNAEGSFWHAIMHRMEGDNWNAKYWYQQVGRHEVIDRIAARLKTAWAPSSFVDQCERVGESPPESSAPIAIRRVAQIAWQELFAYCWEQASGEQASNGPAPTSSPPTGNS
ncbi:MAG: hypothetical protein Q8M16_17340 [Pirellulaceae bacterium]|nr:hypothetical protein [Pirellulaceae bacterium]